MFEIKQYIDDILTNRINSNSFIKQACELYLKNLERTDIYLNTDELSRIIKFFSFLKTNNLQPLILQPWQKFFIANICFYYKKDNRRKHNELVLFVGRKNGKSTLIAGILLYFLLYDKEYYRKLVLSANSLKQGQEIFELVDSLAQQIDQSNKIIQRFKTRIKYKEKNSIEVVNKNYKSLDGKNIYVNVSDEAAASEDIRQYNTLVSSQGARISPLRFLVTTAHYNKQNWFFERLELYKKILSGEIVNDTVFPLLYCLESQDDYTDSTNWIKANPNLNISVRPEYLENEVLNAKQSVAYEIEVLTKYFNIFTDVKEVWIKSDHINSALQKLDINNFQNETCFIGTDLSTNNDISALSKCYKIDDKYYFFNTYYLPEDSLNSNKDKFLYRKFNKEGYIKLVKGNVIDYNTIMKDIIETNNIEKIYYDSWNALKFVIDLGEIIGAEKLEAFKQRIGNFNMYTKEFERQLLLGNIIIEDNAITKWMFDNCMLEVDKHGNIMPTKVDGKRRLKIDGIVAMIMAFSGQFQQQYYSYNIY